MGFEHVTVDDEDSFRVITMNRAHRRNSLSEAHLIELEVALADAAGSNARGVILAASGPVFSSGHDFADMAERDLTGMQALLERCAAVMQAVPEMPQPVVAQVQGLATAGGCQLVASCDLAVAAESAVFQVPGGKGGWFCTTPGVAVSRAIGRKRALEMLLTGDPIDAHTAAEWGLVNRVVADADLEKETRELLRRATRGSVESKAIGKRAFYRHVEMDLAHAYPYATEVMASASQTPSGQESMAAFLDKRRPRFDPGPARR